MLRNALEDLPPIHRETATIAVLTEAKRTLDTSPYRFRVEDPLLSRLNSYGVPLTGFELTAHPHGAHKNIEEHFYRSQLGPLTNGQAFTTLFMKESKHHRLQNLGLNSPKVLNKIVTSRDHCRYEHDSPLSIETAYAYMDYAIMFYTPAQILGLFVMNPKLEHLVVTAVIPPESGDYDQSIDPDFYTYFVRSTDKGDYLTYMPEGHANGSYDQPRSAINWLSLANINGPSFNLEVNLESTFSSHHVITIHKSYENRVSQSRVFSSPDMTLVPDATHFRIPLTERAVPTSVFHAAFAYVRSIRTVRETDCDAWVRTQRGKPEHRWVHPRAWDNLVRFIEVTQAVSNPAKFGNPTLWEKFKNWLIRNNHFHLFEISIGGVTGIASFAALVSSIAVYAAIPASAVAIFASGAYFYWQWKYRRSERDHQKYTRYHIPDRTYITAEPETIDAFPDVSVFEEKPKFPSFTDYKQSSDMFPNLQKVPKSMIHRANLPGMFEPLSHKLKYRGSSLFEPYAGIGSGTTQLAKYFEVIYSQECNFETFNALFHNTSGLSNVFVSNNVSAPDQHPECGALYLDPDWSTDDLRDVRQWFTPNREFIILQSPPEFDLKVDGYCRTEELIEGRTGKVRAKLTFYSKCDCDKRRFANIEAFEMLYLDNMPSEPEEPAESENDIEFMSPVNESLVSLGTVALPDPVVAEVPDALPTHVVAEVKDALPTPSVAEDPYEEVEGISFLFQEAAEEQKIDAAPSTPAVIMPPAPSVPAATPTPEPQQDLPPLSGAQEEHKYAPSLIKNEYGDDRESLIADVSVSGEIAPAWKYLDVPEDHPLIPDLSFMIRRRTYRSVAPYPLGKDCLLVAFSKSTGISTALLWDQLRNVLPDCQLYNKGIRDVGLNTMHLAVLCWLNSKSALVKSGDQVYRYGAEPFQVRILHTARPAHFEYDPSITAVAIDAPADKPVSTGSSTFTADLLRAKTLLSDLRAGREGIKGTKDPIYSEYLDKIDRLFDTKPSATVKIELILGFPGCGKSKPLADYLLTRKNDYRVIVPTANLRQEWKTKLLQNKVEPWQVNTWENGFNKQTPLVVIDEIFKIPRGYLDLLVLADPSIKKVIVLGDPAQSEYFPIHPESINMSLSSEISRLTPLATQYLAYSYRCPIAVADFFGVPSLQQAPGFFKECMPEKGDIVLTATLSAQKSFNDVGHCAYTMSGSQGLTFDRPVYIFLDKSVNNITNNVQLVALTRSRIGVYFFGDCSLLRSGNSLFRSAFNGHTVNMKELFPELRRLNFVSFPNRKSGGNVEETRNLDTSFLPETRRALHYDFENPTADTPSAQKGLPTPCFVEPVYPGVHFEHLASTFYEPRDPQDLEKYIQGEFSAQFADLNSPREIGAQALRTIAAKHDIRADPTLLIGSIEKRLRFRERKTPYSLTSADEQLGFFLFQSLCEVYGRSVKTKVPFDEALFIDCIALNEYCQLSSKTQAVLIANARRSDPDWRYSVVRIFSKTQHKVNQSSLFGSWKACQTLALMHDAIVLIFGPIKKYQRVFDEQDRPDWLYTHAKKTPEDLSAFCQSRLKTTRSLTNDYTAFDQSQHGEAVVLERYKMARLSIPQEMIDLHCFIKTNIETQFGPLTCMRLTGEPGTYDDNTDYNLAVLNLRYKLNSKHTVFVSGDDSAIIPVPRDNQLWSAVAPMLHLQFKLEVNPHTLFCGYFLGPAGAVRDPLGIFAKLAIAVDENRLPLVLESHLAEFSTGHKLGDELFSVLPQDRVMFQSACFDLFCRKASAISKLVLRAPGTEMKDITVRIRKQARLTQRAYAIYKAIDPDFTHANVVGSDYLMLQGGHRCRNCHACTNSSNMGMSTGELIVEGLELGAIAAGAILVPEIAPVLAEVASEVIAGDIVAGIAATTAEGAAESAIGDTLGDIGGAMIDTARATGKVAAEAAPILGGGAIMNEAANIMASGDHENTKASGDHADAAGPSSTDTSKPVISGGSGNAEKKAGLPTVAGNQAIDFAQTLGTSKSYLPVVNAGTMIPFSVHIGDFKYQPGDSGETYFELAQSIASIEPANTLGKMWRLVRLHSLELLALPTSWSNMTHYEINVAWTDDQTLTLTHDEMMSHISMSRVVSAAQVSFPTNDKFAAPLGSLNTVLRDSIKYIDTPRVHIHGYVPDKTDKIPEGRILTSFLLRGVMYVGHSAMW